MLSFLQAAEQVGSNCSNLIFFKYYSMENAGENSFGGQVVHISSLEEFEVMLRHFSNQLVCCF
jgi:hypothetical protein